jgi:hypothetical protein
MNASLQIWPRFFIVGKETDATTPGLSCVSCVSHSNCSTCPVMSSVVAEVFGTVLPETELNQCENCGTPLACVHAKLIIAEIRNLSWTILLKFTLPSILKRPKRPSKPTSQSPCSQNPGQSSIHHLSPHQLVFDVIAVAPSSGLAHKCLCHMNALKLVS